MLNVKAIKSFLVLTLRLQFIIIICHLNHLHLGVKTYLPKALYSGTVVLTATKNKMQVIKLPSTKLNEANWKTKRS